MPAMEESKQAPSMVFWWSSLLITAAVLVVVDILMGRLGIDVVMVGSESIFVDIDEHHNVANYIYFLILFRLISYVHSLSDLCSGHVTFSCLCLSTVHMLIWLSSP